MCERLDPGLRYSRCIPALSKEELSVLKSRKAAVIGCGGLGGHILGMLARIGIGCIAFADPDRFEASNLNRQVFSTETNLGKGKVEETERMLSQINSGIRLEPYPFAFSRETADRVLDRCDIVLDALDSGTAKRLLAAECGKRNLVLVHGAISGWCAQVCTVPPESGILELLYPDGEMEEHASSLPFLPSLCASLQVSEAVRYLVGRPCALRGKLLSVDTETMEAHTVVLWNAEEKEKAEGQAAGQH